MLFRHVGEFESSKSAMKTFAPELSALMIILRSTGPVISTRRSLQVGGNRRDLPIAFADGRGFRKKSRHAAVHDLLLPRYAATQQLLARVLETARQSGDEADRGGRENLVRAYRKRPAKFNAVGREERSLSSHADILPLFRGQVVRWR